MTSTLSAPPTYGDAFPNSTKVYLEGPRGIRVPMREIALSGGEPPLRVYDPSGPQGHDVREGLPGVRDEWIRERDVDEAERHIPHSERSEEPSSPRSSHSRAGSSLRSG